MGFTDDLRQRTRARVSRRGMHAGWAWQAGVRKQKHSVTTIAGEMGIPTATLLAFLNGKGINSTTLDRIVAWHVALSVAPRSVAPRSHRQVNARRAMPLRGARTVLLGQPLSGREEQVLAILARGSTQEQAGIELGMSVQTVKNHVTSILAKLDAQNMVNAVYRQSRALWRGSW